MIFWHDCLWCLLLFCLKSIGRVSTSTIFADFSYVILQDGFLAFNVLPTIAVCRAIGDHYTAWRPPTLWDAFHYAPKGLMLLICAGQFESPLQSCVYSEYPTMPGGF